MNKFTTVVFRMTALVLTFAAGAFGQTNQMATNSAQETAQTSPPPDGAQGSPDRPELQHRNPRYQVMRDDTLMVSFPLAPELNQKITVQPDGYITLQNIGSLYIQGMTVPEIVEALKKAYAKVLHDPIIDVDLIDFQKPYFIVTGQVGKPGQYDLRHDTTVAEAIAVAGGFLPTAKTQVFVYHRVSSGWMEVKKLSLKDLLNGKNVNEDIQMQPGDMVFVPEKFIAHFRKYVPYTSGIYANPQSFF
jgi:protein involved in polysaccharide export with SLBB domain